MFNKLYVQDRSSEFLFMCIPCVTSSRKPWISYWNFWSLPFRETAH